MYVCMCICVDVYIFLVIQKYSICTTTRLLHTQIYNGVEWFVNASLVCSWDCRCKKKKRERENKTTTVAIPTRNGEHTCIHIFIYECIFICECLRVWICILAQGVSWQSYTYIRGHNNLHRLSGICIYACVSVVKWQHPYHSLKWRKHLTFVPC